MPKFKKKPVVIEAIQYRPHNNCAEVCAFLGIAHTPSACDEAGDPGFIINTLEGQMRADAMDWIIKGVKGEFYPCKPDIFAATYESIE